ncbi:hypothetical protein BDAP_002107 [Binucleata daphniae]
MYVILGLLHFLDAANRGNGNRNIISSRNKGKANNNHRTQSTQTKHKKKLNAKVSKDAKIIIDELQITIKNFIYNMIPWYRIDEWIAEKHSKNSELQKTQNNYYNFFYNCKKEYENNVAQTVKNNIYEEVIGLMLKPLKTKHKKLFDNNGGYKGLVKTLVELIINNRCDDCEETKDYMQKITNGATKKDIACQINIVYTKYERCRQKYLDNLHVSSYRIFCEESLYKFMPDSIKKLENDAKKEQIYSQIVMLRDKYQENTLNKYLFDDVNQINNNHDGIKELVEFICKQFLDNFTITKEEIEKLQNCVDMLFCTDSYSKKIKFIEEQITKLNTGFIDYLSKISTNYTNDDDFDSAVQNLIMVLINRTLHHKNTYAYDTCNQIAKNSENILYYTSKNMTKDELVQNDGLLEEFISNNIQYKEIIMNQNTDLQQESMKKQIISTFVDFCKLYPTLLMNWKIQIIFDRHAKTLNDMNKNDMASENQCKTSTEQKTTALEENTNTDEQVTCIDKQEVIFLFIKIILKFLQNQMQQN